MQCGAPDPRTIVWSRPPSIAYRFGGTTLVVSLSKLYAFVVALVIVVALYALLSKTVSSVQWGLLCRASRLLG